MAKRQKKGGAVRQTTDIWPLTNTKGVLVQPIEDTPPSPSNTEILQRKTDQAWLAKRHAKSLRVTEDSPGGPGTFQPNVTKNTRFR